MKPSKVFPMLLIFCHSIFAGSTTFAQINIEANQPVINCQYPIFSQQFQNGMFANEGSDLYNGLPRNGSYQVVESVDQLGGGGYLQVQPQVPGYFLAAHTSNTTSDRVWYTEVPVMWGVTYNFCASVALLKNLGKGANYQLGVYANGKLIGSGRVNFEWSQICGSYTVPDNVDRIEFSIRDPKKGLFFVAIDDICISTARPVATRNAYNPQVKTGLSVFPNPANKNFNVKMDVANGGTATVRLLDNTGTTLYTNKTILTAGSNILKLNDLGTIPSGMYMVQVVTGNKIYNKTIMIGK